MTSAHLLIVRLTSYIVGLTGASVFLRLYLVVQLLKNCISTRPSLKLKKDHEKESKEGALCMEVHWDLPFHFRMEIADSIFSFSSNITHSFSHSNWHFVKWQFSTF